MPGVTGSIGAPGTDYRILRPGDLEDLTEDPAAVGAHPVVGGC